MVYVAICPPEWYRPTYLAHGLYSDEIKTKLSDFLAKWGRGQRGVHVIIKYRCQPTYFCSSKAESSRDFIDVLRNDFKKNPIVHEPSRQNWTHRYHSGGQIATYTILLHYPWVTKFGMIDISKWQLYMICQPFSKMADMFSSVRGAGEYQHIWTCFYSREVIKMSRHMF